MEPTDEMLTAFREAVRQGGDSTDEIRAAGIAAVLAIVERDQAGPCSVTIRSLAGDGDIWCLLRHGHAGDHESGPTRWKESRPASRWRCNTTERCFREDNHDGPHAFPGQTPTP